MSKRIFILIIILMSISLIGIISIQVYWINSSINSKKKQFDNDVKIAMASTSEIIKNKEEHDIRQEYNKFIKNNRFRKDAEIKNYIFERIDTTSNEKLTFTTILLEENFKIPGLLENDSTFIKKITGKQSFMSVKLVTSGKDLINLTTPNRFIYIKTFDDVYGPGILKFANQWKQTFPLYKRLTSKTLNSILKEELLKRNIKQKYNFRVYNNDIATPLKSNYFNIDLKNDYSYPFLDAEKGITDYKLYLSFPNEKKNLLYEMYRVLLLSFFFIIIIIATFSASLYQLLRQKKISEIKTDFINNMTHEFKTPIATINLALDAIKNPKVIKNENSVKRYVKMIRDENKRMHGQVESVLRISKLEKKQIDIRKETVNMKLIIKEAIDHLKLLITDKKGFIKTNFNAITTDVLGNHFHLVNVIVNIIENAIKYSEGQPQVEVFTESTNKFFILKIKDKGIGMGKQAQKHIFDKFYREYKGNIHNVKGHGLGLAYVKKIIDNHQGTIYVNSEKGKGSIFTVKLPLI